MTISRITYDRVTMSRMTLDRMTIWEFAEWRSEERQLSELRSTVWQYTKWHPEEWHSVEYNSTWHSTECPLHTNTQKHLAEWSKQYSDYYNKYTWIVIFDNYLDQLSIFASTKASPHHFHLKCLHFLSILIRLSVSQTQVS